MSPLTTAKPENTGERHTQRVTKNATAKLMPTKCQRIAENQERTLCWQSELAAGKIEVKVYQIQKQLLPMRASPCNLSSQGDPVQLTEVDIQQPDHLVIPTIPQWNCITAHRAHQGTVETTRSIRERGLVLQHCHRQTCGGPGPNCMSLY